MMRRLALVTILAAACGMQPPDGSGNADAGAGGSDGRPSNDSASCDVLLTTQPAVVGLGDTVRVTGTSSRGGGFLTHEWQVIGPSGSPVPFTIVSPDESQIEFVADEPGTYTISMAGDSGCSGVFSFQVVPAGAVPARFILRYLVGDTAIAPAQDDPVAVELLGGGSTWAIGDRHLAGGRRARTTFVDGAGAAIPAYVRLTPAGGGPVIEAIAGDGALDVLLTAGPHELLVAPYVGAVPRRLTAVTADTLPASLTLATGDLLTGVVTIDGTPLADATVALATGGLPASVGTTDGAGTFATRVDVAAGPLAVHVVAPAGRPSCDLVSAAPVAAGATITATLSEVSARTVAGTARTPAGAPLANARVTLVATSLPPCAGTLGGVSVAGVSSARAETTTATDGTFGPLALPAGTYDVIVEPAAGAAIAPAHTTLDLTAADAPTLDLRAGATTPRTVHVTLPIGADASGAALTFVPTPVHGLLGAWRATATTAADGTATIALPPNFAFTVAVTPPRGAAAVAPTTVPLGDAATLEVALPAGITLSGALLYPLGGGQPGIPIEAWCEACPDRRRVDSTATGPGGAFRLRVPDPGVAAPP